MADVMVTARMSPEKKEAANRVFEQLGTNASRAINDLYDYVIVEKKLPMEQEGGGMPTREELLRAKAFVDELCRPPRDPRFATMSLKEAKAERLRKKGLL